MKLTDYDISMLLSKDSLEFSIDNYTQAGYKMEYKENIDMMTEELIKMKIHNDLDGIFGEYGELWEDVINVNGYDFLEDYLSDIGASYNYVRADSYDSFIENVTKSNVYDFNYKVSEIVNNKNLENINIGNDMML